jgi:hypothetical protein
MSLYNLQTNLSFLLGAGFTHPNHTTAHRTERFWIKDNFDKLSAPKVETSAQPVTFFRGIEDETGEPSLIAVQIDDEAGAPLQHHALRAADLGGTQTGHSLTSSSWSGDNTPGLVLHRIIQNCAVVADHLWKSKSRSLDDDHPQAHLMNRLIPTNAQPMAIRPEAIMSKSKRMPAPVVNPT